MRNVNIRIELGLHGCIDVKQMLFSITGIMHDFVLNLEQLYYVIFVIELNFLN